MWTLVRNSQRLFAERIQAWPSGPVVRSLYGELKSYGSAPIDERYLGSQADMNKTIAKFSAEIKSTLDEVYEKYMTKTAFELVALTHSERPWLEARRGLGPTQPSDREISDDTILHSYGEE